MRSSENFRKRILLDFCFWDYPFALACRYAVLPAAKKDDEESDDKHSDVAAFINHRLSLISLLEEHTLEREKLQGAAETRSFSLPPADATDKLLRYEAHLDKQLYRAMGQLERLQRLRRGESVPPPLDIE
jgi:CRISPR/Cas system-associated endonuclease Cas1